MTHRTLEIIQSSLSAQGTEGQTGGAAQRPAWETRLHASSLREVMSYHCIIVSHWSSV